MPKRAGPVPERQQLRPVVVIGRTSYMKLKGYLPRRLAKQKDAANGTVLPRQEDVDGDDDNDQATALGRSWSLESDLRISKGEHPCAISTCW